MFWEQPFSAARRAAALGHWWVGRADGGNTGEVPRSLFWTISRRRKTYGSQGHGSAASLSLTRIQLVECALQFFKLLSSLAELAFRCQALVVGKVFGCFGNERVEIRCGLGRCGGGQCASQRFRRHCGGSQRRGRSAKKGRHRRFEGNDSGTKCQIRFCILIRMPCEVRHLSGR